MSEHKGYWILVALACIFFFTLNTYALVDTNLIDYYNFDEASGDLLDRVNYDNNATNTNITYGETGLINDSYFYSGYSEFDKTLSIFNGNNWTIAGWFYPHTNSGTQRLFDAVNTVGGSGDSISINFRDGSGFVRCYYSGATAISSRTLDMNQWHLVTCDYNNGWLTLRVDNNIEASTAAAGTTSSTKPMGLGRAFDDSELFNGRMDEWSFWNRQLSSSEITELYNSGAGLAYPFPIEITPDFNWIVNKTTPDLNLFDQSTSDLITINDWNWLVDGSTTGLDNPNAQNPLFSPIVAATDYNICLDVGGTYLAQTYKSNICQTINTGRWYADWNIYMYDENTSTNLDGISLNVSDGTNDIDFSFDQNVFLTYDNNLSTILGPTTETITLTFTKIGYGTRYYVLDANQYLESDLNISFALLPTTLTTSVPLKVYQTDETTIYSNTYVELYRPDKYNFITGRQKTDASGNATFNLHTSDQNYYANVNNGAFTYQPVALTILYPKDEETLVQIVEDWRIDITNNLFISYTDLNANKVIYLLPNTANAFNIKISDMNGNYFSRTYAKQYPGNPLTDTLQPYLVPIDEGLLTTIKTISSYTNEPIPNITIKIYKNIAALGRTLVEQIVTDDKGEALTLLNINDEYEFEIYDADLEYIRTDNITSTSSTIYVKIAILNLVDPTLNNYYIGQAFNPTRTKLITTDTSLTQTTTITNQGTSITISQIDYWITNTDQNGSGTDVNIYSTTVNPGTTTYTNTFDLNQTSQTIQSVFYDTNGFIKINVLVTTSDGNKYFYVQDYKPLIGFDWLYQAGIGLRSIFGCSGTNPDVPCPTMLLAALFFSILITISIAVTIGFTNMEGMGFILLGVLGIFTYFNWVPYILYGIIVVSMMVIGVAIGGKRI